jgi:hypothetical protein
MEPVST